MAYVYLMSSAVGPKTYVGSTRDMVHRKSKHKCSSECTSEILIKEYGWDNIIFTVLEECTVERQRECEQYWIDFVPNTVNTRNAFATEDIIKKQHQSYVEANREAIRERDRVRYKANREIILEKKRAHYQAKKTAM